MKSIIFIMSIFLVSPNILSCESDNCIQSNAQISFEDCTSNADQINDKTKSDKIRGICFDIYSQELDHDKCIQSAKLMNNTLKLNETIIKCNKTYEQEIDFNKCSKASKLMRYVSYQDYNYSDKERLRCLKVYQNEVSYYQCTQSALEMEEVDNNDKMRVTCFETYILK